MRVSQTKTGKYFILYLTSHIFCPDSRGSMGAFYKVGSVSGHAFCTFLYQA